MKGQYRILTEVLLFAIGVAITSYIIISFDDVHEVLSENSIQSQLNSVNNYIASGIIKGYGKNSTIKLQVPDSVSGVNYRYFLDCNDEICSINSTSLDSSNIKVSKKLFNVGIDYIINGDLTNAARFIEINTIKGSPGTIDIVR